VTSARFGGTALSLENGKSSFRERLSENREKGRYQRTLWDMSHIAGSDRYEPELKNNDEKRWGGTCSVQVNKQSHEH